MMRNAGSPYVEAELELRIMRTGTCAPPEIPWKVRVYFAVPDAPLATVPRAKLTLGLPPVVVALKIGVAGISAVTPSPPLIPTVSPMVSPAESVTAVSVNCKLVKRLSITSAAEISQPMVPLNWKKSVVETTGHAKVTSATKPFSGTLNDVPGHPAAVAACK